MCRNLCIRHELPLVNLLAKRVGDKHHHVQCVSAVKLTETLVAWMVRMTCHNAQNITIPSKDMHCHGSLHWKPMSPPHNCAIMLVLSGHALPLK
mmetsp:Transcript_14622/g.42866  ORF Transcript_14622/g.42866 Transcript_14622/m.42866 type:complete len:94 (+) Transcript_14622:170-451(+)